MDGGKYVGKWQRFLIHFWTTMEPLCVVWLCCVVAVEACGAGICSHAHAAQKELKSK